MPHPIRLAPSGLVGAPPPADAPREVSQPLTAAAQADMLAKARAHAGQMSPIAAARAAGVHVSDVASPGMTPHTPRPPIPPPEGLTGLASPGVVETMVEVLPPSTSPPNVPALATSPPSVSPAEVSPAALPALPPDATPAEMDDPVVNSRPARGQPHPVADPTLRPTGGFGVPGAEGVMGFGEQTEYFPLDGSEVREVILSLMDKLVVQIQRDLRLTISTTYPLCAATVTVKVACDQPDQTFVIEQAVDEARGFPPDLLREQLGLAVPRKQAIQTPTGTVMVDRLT